MNLPGDLAFEAWWGYLEKFSGPPVEKQNTKVSSKNAMEIQSIFRCKIRDEHVKNRGTFTLQLFLASGIRTC